MFMISSFAELFDNKDSIISLFYERIDESELNKKIEHDAAVKIQRCWRGMASRRVLRKMSNAALVIQRCARRHFAGKVMLLARVDKSDKERRDFYDFQARQIQRVWRGFYSRKYVFDYYRQKSFIDGQAVKNAEMDTMLHEYYRATNEFHENVKHNQSVADEQNKALHLHYLVGTSAIPSIFTAPSYRKETENYPALEEYIKAVNRAKIVVPSLNSGRLQ